MLNGLHFKDQKNTQKPGTGDLNQQGGQPNFALEIEQGKPCFSRHISD